VSAADGSGGPERQQGIASAIAEVSERATLLIREEIELAKAEITEKTTKLAKGAVVAIVAGIFFLTALFFVLVGLAWLLYFELPIGNQFTYFWGFFAMALILVVLGVIAGLVAAKAVKSGAPVPEMAIAEARKIRETVGGGSGGSSGGDGAGSPVGFMAPPIPVASPVAPGPPSGGSDVSSAVTQDFEAFAVEPPVEGSHKSPSGSESQASQLGREAEDGPALDE